MIDEDTSWQKQLLVGVGLLLVVGLLVGGIIGLVALKAADVAGVGETQAPDTGPPPGLGPTSASPPTTAPTSTQTTEPAPTTTTTTRTRQPPPRPIQLVADPLQATTYQRVNLTGTYRAPPGTILQVERNEGSGWAEFDTTASVSAGTFSTYIATGIVGPNRFRVVDTSTGKLSNVVIVMIG